MTTTNPTIAELAQSTPDVPADAVALYLARHGVLDAATIHECYVGEYAGWAAFAEDYAADRFDLPLEAFDFFNWGRWRRALRGSFEEYRTVRGTVYIWRR